MNGLLCTEVDFYFSFSFFNFSFLYAFNFNIMKKYSIFSIYEYGVIKRKKDTNE